MKNKLRFTTEVLALGASCVPLFTIPFVVSCVNTTNEVLVQFDEYNKAQQFCKQEINKQREVLRLNLENEMGADYGTLQFGSYGFKCNVISQVETQDGFVYKIQVSEVIAKDISYRINSFFYNNPSLTKSLKPINKIKFEYVVKNNI